MQPIIAGFLVAAIPGNGESYKVARVRVSYLISMLRAELLKQRTIFCCHAKRLHDSSVGRSEEHTSELQSLMRISYAVFCLKKKNRNCSSSSKQTREL